MGYNHRNFNFTLVILGVVASQLAVSLYLPSLPAIRHQWQLSVGQTQLTLSVFFLSFGISQLFYGALSDHLGRKPLLLLGIMILAGSSVWAIYAMNFDSLLGARFLQGLGASALSLLARAVIRDLFHGSELRKAISVLAIAASFTPGLAPSLGGFLQQHFNWRSNFVALAIYSFILLIIIFTKLTETNVYKRQPGESFNARDLLENYQFVLKNKIFLVYVLSVLVGYLAMIICLENTPFLLEAQFGFSAEITGYLMLVQPAFFLLGNLIQHKLSHLVSGDKLIQAGMILLALVSVSFLLQAALDFSSVITLLITLAFNGLAVSFILVNSISGGLLPFTDKAGQQQRYRV
ncbi:Bcr/CflA family efflux MFS transporter [Piscirickettsia litoralis]|uniref:Bcr/CflA family efflux transporter n=1 Tax=Piscirickettsia litoralis TaxID=1891921 RepID=A0ABX3AAG8_9GAMM|nr:Bcr/CflA family efflux MFS transporter [Piscirickettsia litoralis]ODN43124.1 hypothetical protein BGC07_09640 [Piscirickettsia litoralis]